MTNRRRSRLAWSQAARVEPAPSPKPFKASAPTTVAHTNTPFQSQNTMASVLPKNINAADLRFSDLKSLDNGSKTSYVSNKGSRVFVQTPLMHLPYGINNSADMEAKKNPGKPVVGPPRYDVCVAFRDMERNHKVKELYDCMIGVQNAVIDAAFTNRLAWFRNDFKGNRDFVVDKFQPIIKLDLDPETNEPRNRGYAPTMKAKLPYDADNDAFTFECVDADKNVLDFKKIVEKMKGGKAQLLIQLTGLWFAGGRFGCSWKVHKAKFEMPGGIHVDWEEDSDGPEDMEEDDAEEEARRQQAQQQQQKKPRIAAPVPDMLPDSEEEEAAEGAEVAESDDDALAADDPTPPPPLPKGKKPAAKKAGK